ncbi:hypothetical protein VNO78_24602 [Psophocarpus tetragonolobus]|uniref:BHLH domain-containing protein n=1 Tax=Psophocarpus tetragonolobus TaxID=3891 RepID=A0AAN9S6E8_PSOTE
MLRFNSDSFVAKQEYSPCLNNSSQEELGSCYFPIRGAESHAKPRENNFNRGTKRARTSSETQHHIMSERKRRQDIAEKFIALSAIIPGLKKIDKATVLGEAINYMRQLEQRIAVLEKGNDNNKSIKSVMVTKSGLCSASASCNEVIPEVEARGLDKDVLIRIYCHKRKGIMLKLLALLKDVHLSIASTSVLPFGNSILSIIIIAQMTEKYNLTMNDLVNKVKQIF